jgi:hypothetical protein
MKYITGFILFFLCWSISPLYSQEKPVKKYNPDYPILFQPQNHDPNFSDFPEKSFYESRNNWQAIIDSTWGPGLPLGDKLLIFDQYASAVQDQFDGFLSLGMNWIIWDSLRNHYRNQIIDSTSRGGFSAIMSQLARNLRDGHTHAYDEGVTQTPLNPGVPVLMYSGFLTIEHFGAVLTALPDSNLLILRTVPNHPLGLQPGDIILGYQGVPWKILVHELLNAGLPFVPNGTGAANADSDFLLLGAGMNWHLFDIMDIIQYSTGDTLHLAVAPMINLNVPSMLNNEQMEIPGIPFPDYFNGERVSYGILSNTNIGYIYLFAEWPTAAVDQQFAQAVNALQYTDGLIIDMRLNFGGWALFDDAFDILFNDFTLTIEDAYRLSQTTLALLPAGNANEFQIDADPTSLYDHPITILLGPTCISMGDVTAQRFRYHPMVRFFGKPPAASLGFSLFVDNIPDWYLRYSISDMFHVKQPSSYLNRAEFPIDFPVWHNPSDVAKGVDAVVEASLGWINSMIYAHNVKTNSVFIRPAVDTLNITANVKNPPNHNLQVAAIINTLDSVLVDSLPMFDDGNHGDSLAGDGIYGCLSHTITTEDIFTIGASVTDLDSTHYHILPNAKRFTTVGPMVLDSLIIYDGYTVGLFYEIPFKIMIRNNGLITTANNIRAYLSTSHPRVTGIENNNQSLGDIMSGQAIISPDSLVLQLYGPEPIENIALHINFYSDNFIYWQDSTDMIVGIKKIEKSNLVPNEFTLNQNYPNPFNPSTTIEFDLPKSCEVTLKVFNILGEEVATLVSDRLSTGSYSYEWDASNLASGVYLYRLQAGELIETKKMVLIK